MKRRQLLRGLLAAPLVPVAVKASQEPEKVPRETFYGGTPGGGANGFGQAPVKQEGRPVIYSRTVELAGMNREFNEVNKSLAKSMQRTKEKIVASTSKGGFRWNFGPVK